MLWRIARSPGVIALVIVLSAVAYWWLHPRTLKAIGIEYVGDRTATLWSTLAQVRQPVAELHYGDRVEIIREEGTSAQLRTPSGTLGWLMDTRQLMNTELWAQSASLLEKARTMPTQAIGQTKTVSNVRVEPGRNSKRIFQLPRGTQVTVLGRTLADVPSSGDEGFGAEKSPTVNGEKPKQEDWLFILSAGSGFPESKPRSDARISTAASGDPVSSGQREAKSSPTTSATSLTPIAGWVLARFIQANLPGPVADYASSADLHVVAWFELNHVADGSGGEVPQYLVAGSRGGEGQPCDFTMLRVYTWGAARKRYETAYVEGDLCGRLPIQVSKDANGPQFHFLESAGNKGDRTYVMRQTSVHRVKENVLDGSRNPKSPVKR